VLFRLAQEELVIFPVRQNVAMSTAVTTAQAMRR